MFFVAAYLVVFEHSQEDGHKLVSSQIGGITRFHEDVSLVKQEQHSTLEQWKGYLSSYLQSLKGSFQDRLH